MQQEVAGREASESLQDRIDSLEGTLRERDLLIGVISHELRTPLTTIFGNAHLLLAQLEHMDTATRTQAISDIREQAERLNGMVENMLLMARAGAQTTVPTEPVLMRKAISEVVLDHQKRNGKRCIIVSVTPVGLMADGQPDYLKQVVQNLLSNAEKYSPGNRRIDIRASRTGNEVITSIRDRGSGLVPGEAEIIFQPFFRSGATSTKVSGAGIGLAVCKLLVQAQSGRIWAAPRRGGGSAFSFSLPIAASFTV